MNQKCINYVRSNNRRCLDNLPKILRVALAELKSLTRNKIIDIRKVDKGNLILIIDFQERLKIEEKNITKIAKLCDVQLSNAEANREYIDHQMTKLYDDKFIERNELISVTGILPGGVSGKLFDSKTKERKDTRTTDSNEYFTIQSTPYVYPLLKAHKLDINDLNQVSPSEVSQKIPARLVVGMSNCQMSRVQAWLEAFLTPLSKFYGRFEYTKDSTDILIEFDKLNQVAQTNEWDFKDIILFGIDVEALYPSVKFHFLKKALVHCFDSCTNWSTSIKNTLVDIIIYTLSNQQVKWDNKFYILNQGIPTGGKHCVPLANILLSYILIDILKSDPNFATYFNENLKLWKRYIDDIGGVFLGKAKFDLFFYELKKQFTKYDLNLTYETSNRSIILLDIEIFIEDGLFHTREHRKQTASSSYVKFGSAHPKHSFKGIVKSQLKRIRRLCSKDCDFMKAVQQLRQRCINSGYMPEMVDGILLNARSMKRELFPHNIGSITNSDKVIRWVTLAGTTYEKSIGDFVSKINKSLVTSGIKFQVVKSTGQSLGSMLFHNNVQHIKEMCTGKACVACRHKIRSDAKVVMSPINGRIYPINSSLTCIDSGIYCITCPCSSLYVGKTTSKFKERLKSHFNKSKKSAVLDHSLVCSVGSNVKNYTMLFLEDMHARGKYSLSEREFLWNERLRGDLNIQKTLKS